MNWASYRARFPAVSKLTYLNTAGGCPISLEAAAAGKQYFDEILEGGDTHWSAWMERVEKVRQQVADFLNAEASEIAFVPTASHGMNLIAQMLGQAGQSVLSADREFPSTTLPWLNQGVEVLIGGLKDDLSVDLVAAERLIDSETSAVVASHVQYHTGYRYELSTLRQLCDMGGLRLVLDATQSVGAYSIDVRRDQIDALVFSGYKFTTAGYGIACLYIKKELLASISSAIVGWRTAREPYDMIFDRLDLTNEACGLEAGHPLFPGIFTLGAALSLISKIGMDSITERITQLSTMLQDRLRASGYSISSPLEEKHKSSITLVSVNAAKQVAQKLLERGVFVSYAGENLRISVHFYNNEEDIDVLLHHLLDVAKAA